MCFIRKNNRELELETIRKFVDLYVPKYSKKAYQERWQRTPLVAMLTTEHYDTEGVRLFTNDPQNEEDRIRRDFDSTLNADAQFLNHDIQKVIMPRFSVERLVQLLDSLGIVATTAKDTIREAFDAYYKGNYVLAGPALLVGLEAILRKLIDKAGGKTIIPSEKFDGNQRILMAELINHPNILGKHYTRYLHFLLTDPRGWNLRNNILHGLDVKCFADKTHVDRIFHAYLLIARVASRY